MMRFIFKATGLTERQSNRFLKLACKFEIEHTKHKKILKKLNKD